MMSVRREFDMRDSLNTTWRDTVLAVLQHGRKEMSLQELYEEMQRTEKPKQIRTGRQKSDRRSGYKVFQENITRPLRRCMRVF